MSMKNIYKGYYKKSNYELKSLWDECLITFDANVLLNLYRYSKSTREAILDLIKKLSIRIFLTHQAGLEFHRNRFEVILEQEKSYKDFNNNLIKIEEELKSKSKHPFISDELHKKLDKVLGEVKKEITVGEQDYRDLAVTDEIYEKVVAIFEGKVEVAFSREQLLKIFEEGKKRYAEKIPPGFEDQKDKDGSAVYGDLVLWKQIIEKAKSSKKPIILITDERKKDWWWKLRDGKTVGPRFELVEEIYKEAGVDFHMYSTERFLETGLSNLKENANPKALQEVKDFKEAKQDSDLMNSSDYINKISYIFRDGLRNTVVTESALRNELVDLVTRRLAMKNTIKLLNQENFFSSEELDNYINLTDELDQIEEKIITIKKELEKITK